MNINAYFSSLALHDLHFKKNILTIVMCDRTHPNLRQNQRCTSSLFSWARSLTITSQKKWATIMNFLGRKIWATITHDHSITYNQFSAKIFVKENNNNKMKLKTFFCEIWRKKWNGRHFLWKFDEKKKL